MPRGWIAFFKKGRGDALQLRFTFDFSRLLGSFRALHDTGKALEQGFARAAFGPVAPVHLGA